MPDPDYVNIGDPIRAKDLNNVVDDLKWLRHPKGAGGIQIYRSSAGWTIANNQTTFEWLGVVKATGPNGDESDFNDNRYWVGFATCTNPDSDDKLQAIALTERNSIATDPWARTVVATNFSEQAGSHTLKAGDMVWVKGVTDQSVPPRLRYFISAAKYQPCIVKVTGNASGAGKYTGRVCQGKSTAVASGNLSLPEGMTVPSSDNALVLNAYEDGASGGHIVKANTYYPGVIVGTNGSSPILSVVVINAVPRFALFACGVTQTGGSAGSATTTCSFTYSASDIAGTSLGTVLSPLWARWALGKMVAATHGTGYYDTAGAFKLYQVDEVPDVAACT